MKSTSLQRTAFVVLFATPLLLTGCKSGMWNPSSMFAWSKDKPTESGDLEFPVSPATKFTPNSVASVGAQTGSAGTAGSTTTGAGMVAVSGTQKSPYGVTGNAAGAYGVAGAGLAAKANGYTGYTTGPYQVGNSSAAGNTATAGLPNTANFAATAKPSSGLPNPYGAPTASASTPNITMPDSVASAMQASRNAAASYPGLPKQTGNQNLQVQPAVGNPNTSNAQLPSYGSSGLPSYPSAAGQPSASMSLPKSSAYSSGTTYPPIGASSSSAGSGLPPLPSTSTLPGGTQAGVASGLPSATSVSVPNASSFTPGTTARSTKYNFGN
ncbi:MAG: hypothetical protein AAF483_28790 [Planctomycetota bacterium]